MWVSYLMTSDLDIQLVLKSETYFDCVTYFCRTFDLNKIV